MPLKAKYIISYSTETEGCNANSCKPDNLGSTGDRTLSNPVRDNLADYAEVGKPTH